ncbi:glycosyltransferase family 9 protein [Bacillus tequilensis]|nr:glycosyltransferase family 9 protein [Bacillus tequilensis]
MFSAAGSRPVLLALRALKLGDLLVAVPALHGLRRAFPDHELVLAVPGWLQPIAELIPGVDALLPTPGLDDLLPLPAESVDVAVNLHGNGPESRAIIDALRPRRRIVHRSETDPDGVPWLDGILERWRWARLVSGYGAPADADEVSIAVPQRAPLVEGAAVVHVGAFYGSRAWPVERFAEVARALQDAGGEVVITGGPADRDRADAVARLAGLDESIVRAGRDDLVDLAALIAHASVLVSVDTGAAHLASAYGTPSTIVFGPAPPEEWGPPPGPHIVLTDARLRRGDAFSAEPDPALLAVTAAQVTEAALSVRRR